MLGLLGLASGAAASKLLGRKAQEEQKRLKRRERALAAQVAGLESSLRAAQEGDGSSERLAELQRSADAIKVGGRRSTLSQSQSPQSACARKLHACAETHARHRRPWRSCA